MKIIVVIGLLMAGYCSFLLSVKCEAPSQAQQATHSPTSHIRP